MTPMVGNPCKRFNQPGYPIQRPTVTVKTMSARPTLQCSRQMPLLLPIQSRLSTGSTRPFQSVFTMLLPLVIPAADALAADVKFTGNGRLRHLPS